MRKKIILVVFLMVCVAAPGVSVGARKPQRDKVLKALRSIGISSAKVLGIEPAPVKNLFFVYVDLGREGRRGFVITRDAKYIVAGRFLSVEKGGRDVIMEVGVDKGYFPLPPGRPVNVKVSITGSPSFGSPTAPMVIIYYDPFCPFSLRELRVLKSMADKGRIHLVLKYFIFNGPNAAALARDTVCLYQQGRKREFWAMVFTKGAIVKKLRFKCDPNQAGLIELLLNRDGQEARSLGLRGTPALLIRGKVYTGFINEVMLEKLLLTGGKS